MSSLFYVKYQLCLITIHVPTNLFLKTSSHILNVSKIVLIINNKVSFYTDKQVFLFICDVQICHQYIPAFLNFCCFLLDVMYSVEHQTKTIKSATIFKIEIIIVHTCIRCLRIRVTLGLRNFSFREWQSISLELVIYSTTNTNEKFSEVVLFNQEKSCMILGIVQHNIPCFRFI